MKKWVQDLLKSIIILIIGALLGYYLNNLQLKKSQKFQYFDYETSVNHDIIRLNNSSLRKNIRVYYEDSLIDNLTSVEINIYNLTDIDYDNVDLNIIFKSTQIANHYFQDRYELKGGIEFLSVDTLQNKDISYKYNIKIANRSPFELKYTADNKPVLKATYLLIGIVEPDIKISITKKGLDIRKYDYQNNYMSWFSKPYMPFFLILILFITYFALKKVKLRSSSKQVENKKAQQTK